LRGKLRIGYEQDSPDPSGMQNLRQILHLFVPAVLRFVDPGHDFEGLF
jgi:hypothetical protein